MCPVGEEHISPIAISLVPASTNEPQGMAGQLKKRARIDIYADILEVLKRRSEGALVTRISYGAGLPLDRVKPILETLASYGLISMRRTGESRFYHITHRGIEFLEAYRKVQSFMTFLDPDSSHIM